MTITELKLFVAFDLIKDHKTNKEMVKLDTTNKSMPSKIKNLMTLDCNKK